MARIDKYRNFRELQLGESADAYRMVAIYHASRVAVIAPHGGSIEPGTSEVSRAIAGAELSLYLFEGRRVHRNSDLHITSSNFDEPSGLAIARDSDVVLTVHGESSWDEALVYMGGQDASLGAALTARLQATGFDVRKHHRADLQGVHPENICNKGRTGAGVQLELTNALRVQLFPDLTPKGRATPHKRFFEFVAAVRQALGLSAH